MVLGGLNPSVGMQYCTVEFTQRLRAFGLVRQCDLSADTGIHCCLMLEEKTTLPSGNKAIMAGKTFTPPEALRTQIITAKVPLYEFKQNRVKPKRFTEDYIKDLRRALGIDVEQFVSMEDGRVVEASKYTEPFEICANLLSLRRRLSSMKARVETDEWREQAARL